MKWEPPEDGLHRSFHENGKLSCEFTIKNGLLDGVSRSWHENGQLEEEARYKKGLLNGIRRQWNRNGDLLDAAPFKMGTGIMRRWHENGVFAGEVPLVKGLMTGLFTVFERDGMFLTKSYFYQDHKISKKKYDMLCKKDPSLPRLDAPKTTFTLGNFVRQLRRQQREEAKNGPTPEQLKHLAWRDELCREESRRRDSKEVLAWLGGKSGAVRQLSEMARGEALRLARKLYASGAVKVWATGIERDVDGEQFSNHLVILLPKDAGQRQKIHDLCADPARPSMGGNGAPAIGRGLNYIHVSLL